ncbi:MAG: histidine phosphatase family protein [Chloroflexota bacterium]
MTDPSRIPQTHRVILIRHARSRVDETRHPQEWGLTDDGRAAARRLAALALFEHAAGFYAGPEPKMLDTLFPVAAERDRQVQADPAFAETRGERWLGEAEFLATVRQFFDAPDRPPAPNWETATEAVDRFAAGVERLCAAHAPVAHPGHALPGTFAIASGGRMLTAYLASLLGYTPHQAFESWRGLRMPDLTVLELAAGAAPRLVIPFGALAI